MHETVPEDLQHRKRERSREGAKEGSGGEQSTMAAVL